MTKIYFSSTSSISDDCLDVIGCMESSLQYGVRTNWVNRSNWWCLDSGTFTKPFIEEKWKTHVTKYIPFIDKCKFVVIPDIVYDSEKTLKNFYKYRDFVTNLGFPCAFVTQDGIKISDIPFDLFDVLFIGGSNTHKLGDEARKIINYAKTLNKWIHVGRVNSIKRLNIFCDCDSWDGTHLGFFPSDDKKFAFHIRRLNNEN